MKKKSLVLAIMVAVYLCVLSSSVALASGSYWTQPWKEAEQNLFTLIQEGYDIVGTSASPLMGGMGIVEVVYLQKGKDLYRCVTMATGREEKQSCEVLVAPQQRQ